MIRPSGGSDCPPTVARTRIEARWWLKRGGLFLGCILLIAAIAMVWRQHDAVERAMDSIHSASAGDVVWHASILLASAAANIALSGLLFSLLISRYGKVGVLEMQALIASSTLINYVPMRPGLLGRVAYHKAANDIPIAASAKTVMQAVGLSVMTAGYVALSVFISLRTQINPWLLALAPVPLIAVGGLTMPRQRVWFAAAGVRYGELFVNAARYSAAFGLIGSPIDGRGALAFACVSMVATMVPFLSNGLGLREWAIGLVAPLLTPHHVALGITADLVNRAAEMVIAVPAGLMGLSMLARIQTARGSVRNE